MRVVTISRQWASGRTGVLGGSHLFHQLADDRNRVRPAPSLARLAWLERPDPDSAREDLARLAAARSPVAAIVNEQLTTPTTSEGVTCIVPLAPAGQVVEPERRKVISDRASIDPCRR